MLCILITLKAYREQGKETDLFLWHVLSLQWSCPKTEPATKVSPWWRAGMSPGFSVN